MARRIATLTDHIREGYVSVPDGQVWYRIVGSGGAIPLLTLHGGPGAGHDYLESLEALAADRSVVFYVRQV
jgi:proline iminopeptidase